MPAARAPPPTGKPKLFTIYIRRRDGIIQRYTTKNPNHPQRTKAPTGATKPTPKPPRAQTPTQVPPRPQTPTPGTGGARARARSEFQKKRGATYSTWFKAMGTTGTLRAMRGADSPDLLGGDLEDIAAPAAFYSNQSAVLGRVKWPGIKPLGELIEELNLALQFFGEETDGFDFRLDYPQWEYKYQIIESIGGTPRIAYEEFDARPKRRRG